MNLEVFPESTSFGLNKQLEWLAEFGEALYQYRFVIENKAQEVKMGKYTEKAGREVEFPCPLCAHTFPSTSMFSLSWDLIIQEFSGGGGI